MISAINTKRESDSVIEAISAEDIGKLPDASIADALSRLPGLAARRVDGRASALTIRGLSEDFSSTTLNGREQVSLNDNRGVDFYLYPAEIMGGVTVHKAPDATLNTQGIAGVVDLQTVKPLDFSERTLQVSGMLERNSLGDLNPDIDAEGGRSTVSYIDQFADNTIGVALVATTMKSPNQEERWNAWGATEWPTNADGNIVLGGAKPYVRSSVQNRDSVIGVFEFAPNEKFHLTADAMFIDYNDEKTLRGIEIPAAWGSNGGVEALEVENGFVTEGIIHDAAVVVRNDYDRNEAELHAAGINMTYDFSNSLSLDVDIANSAVERNYWGMETYSGTGRGAGNGATDDIGFSMNGGNRGVMFDPQLDYSDDDLIRLGDPLSWGGGNVLYPDPDDQDGFISMVDIEDELTTFRASLDKKFDGGIITAVNGGIYYSTREKSKKDTGEFLTLPSYPETTKIPEKYRLDNADLSFIGMGEMVAYDAFGFYNDGGYVRTSHNLTADFRAKNTWSVSEEITTAFAKASFSMPVGSLELFGNAGVQVVNTDQSSDGNIVTVGEDGLVDILPTTAGASYVDVLPSLNLNLQLSENQVLRSAFAKTMSRSRMDRLNAGYGYSFNEAANDIPEVSLETSPWSADGGSPALRPQIAYTYDLSYEFYFSDEGYLSAAAFYKDLDSWQVTERTVMDFSMYTPPGGEEAKMNEGYKYVWGEAEGGAISGAELTATLPGAMVSDALDGFGLQGSATFIDSNIEYQGNKANIPGLSESIYNLTAYYEKNGFQFRTSMRMRDDFPASLGYESDPVVIKGSTVWDAQLSYDFAESGISYVDGLSVYLQGYNLTNEPFVAFASGDPRLVRDYQVFGRNLLLGASYKF